MEPYLNGGVYSDEIVVPQSAIDVNGHVNNVVFVQWMQDVAVRHFDAVVGMKTIRALGAMWVVRMHQVEYLAPAFAGDRIQVQTWVVNFSRVRSLRRYRFLRALDGKLIVKGETDWVYVGLENGKPCSIPNEVREPFVLLDQA